jgi:hypothetical protein
MNAKNYFIATAVVFSAVSLLHLLRIVLGWEAVIGSWGIPIWVSWVAMIIAAVFAYTGFTHGWRRR